MKHTVIIDTNLLTKKIHVRNFEEFKQEIADIFGKDRIDWSESYFYLAEVEVLTEIDMTILGKPKKVLLRKTISMDERKLNFDSDLLDCSCTIRGKIVLK